MRSLVVICAVLMAANSPTTVAETASVEKTNADAQSEFPMNDEVVPVPNPPHIVFDREAMLKQEKEIRERAVARLAALLPAEYGAYRKAISSNSEIDTARAAVQIVQKTRELAAKSPKHSEEGVAWMLCLQLFKDSKDPSAEQLILDEWNKGLGHEDDYLLRQLSATYHAFDRRLLTAEFWKLFEKSTKRKTMCEPLPGQLPPTQMDASTPFWKRTLMTELMSTAAPQLSMKANTCATRDSTDQHRLFSRWAPLS